MTKRMSIAMVVPLVSLLLVTGGCSTVNNWGRVGQPGSEKGNVDVGMVVYNVVTTAGLGIIVDILTGSFWMSKHEQPWKFRRSVTPDPAPQPPKAD